MAGRVSLVLSSNYISITPSPSLSLPARHLSELLHYGAVRLHLLITVYKGLATPPLTDDRLGELLLECP